MTESSAPVQIPRREFMKLAASAGCVLPVQGALGVWPPPEEKGARRNLILFLTDQERATMWFPEGWEEANRPALTELKNTGVTFTNSFSNTSMCTPARNTLFTGLYPAQHLCPDVVQQVNIGTVADNQLDPSVPNLGTVLKEAGYEVVYKGKWHLTEGTVLPDGSKVDDRPARCGFDGWNGPDIGSDSNPERLYGGGKYNQDARVVEGYDWAYNDGAGGINPEYEQQSALAYLRDKIANPGTKPFCLIVSLVNPHDLIGYPTYSGDYPTVTDVPTWGYDRSILSGDITENPPTLNENLLANYKPTTHAKYRVLGDLLLGQLDETADESGSGSLNYLNFYANCLKLVDAEFKKILDLLRGTALRDNSWIVYASDHGELGLSHGGLRQKGFCVYEETIKVPMVWSNPVDFQAGGAICEELVSHVDFVPTVCSMLGINPRRYQFSGVDYSSLIKNPSGPAVQDSILFTYDDIYAGQSAEKFPGGIVSPPNRVRAIRDKESKYAYYFDADGHELPQAEFYDMRHKADGGTDTDLDHGLGGSTGQPVEYQNLSQWAEFQRRLRGLPALATPDLEKKRQQMKQKLQRALNTKLRPRRAKAAIPPQDFKVELLNWTNEFNQLESELLLTWVSRETTQYQLQSSRDQKTWTNVNDPITGNNGPLIITQPVTGFKVYYRLTWRANPAPTVIPKPSRLAPV
ncbi:sulfatase-like hydrolase/transferase [Prosthecobacter sp. SYSU 5D2]|uniref:sulfatase-like hydrolase/transferase n=1 Tax=Prosthecobacter sp. SYSU 5D2 TaxID=3134134 RepID=UPI0031FE9C39